MSPWNARSSKLLAERQQLIDDYRELLTTDDERAAYDQMITLAHRVFPYVEGHKFYCEHWYTNLFFNKIREFGALLAQHGFFADAEDVFHLTHYELESAIIDLMTAWSNGSPPRGPAHWPQMVAERRAAIAVWAKHETPPALGAVPDVIDDPAIVMLWGITRETLDAWLSPELSTDPNELHGFAACRGVVEGTARIVKSVDEISRLQKGDILVCQVTNPTWAPIFGKISRRRFRYRRLDEPCGHRRARIRSAGGGGHRQRHLADQGRPAYPRRRRTRYRDHSPLSWRAQR